MAKAVETGSPIAVANQSSLSPPAGKPTTKEMLVDIARLELAYFERRPDLQDPDEHYRELTGEFGISYYTYRRPGLSGAEKEAAKTLARYSSRQIQ